MNLEILQITSAEPGWLAEIPCRPSPALKIEWYYLHVVCWALAKETYIDALGYSKTRNINTAIVIDREGTQKIIHHIYEAPIYRKEPSPYNNPKDTEW